MFPFEVSVSPNAVPPKEYGISPSHKITIKDDMDTFTYWYVQNEATSQPFDEDNDLDLVKRMYEKGRELKIGYFESLPRDDKRDYSLHRINKNSFIIKSLN